VRFAGWVAAQPVFSVFLFSAASLCSPRLWVRLFFVLFFDFQLSTSALIWAGVASLDHTGNALLRGKDALKFSSQRVRPVICITTNSVRIAPIVTANPVIPSKKNAYENSTR
jgi:hypothetical protein